MRLFAADENFNGKIIRGVRRRVTDLDLVRVQDTGLSGAEDPDVFAWAAREGRVILTHDVSTMTAFARARVERGEAMAGVVEIPLAAPIGRVIGDLWILIVAGRAEDTEGQIVHLPF